MAQARGVCRRQCESDRGWFEKYFPVMEAFWQKVLYHREHGIEEPVKKTRTRKKKEEGPPPPCEIKSDSDDEYRDDWIIISQYINEHKSKPVVNVPKSNNIAMIIGVTVLVCCVCCVFIIFRVRSRSSSTKGADIIVKDMEVETSHRHRVLNRVPVHLVEMTPSHSTKPMKVQLYKTYDCSGEPIDAVSPNSVPLETEVKITNETRVMNILRVEWNGKCRCTYDVYHGPWWRKSEHT